MTIPSEAALGALGALASACAWAVIGLLVRMLAPVLNSVAINAVRSTLGGALLLGWVLLTGAGQGLSSISPRAFLLLTVSILIAVGIGDTVFWESARSLGLARAMTVSMTYPVFSTLLAAGLLGEAVSLAVVMGTALTLAGVTLIVTTRHDEPAGAPERFWLGVGAATLASVAWAVSVIVLKVPLTGIDATTAQAVRLPVAGLLLWATPWAWSALGDIRGGGRRAWWTVGWLSALTALSSVMFVAGVKYAGVAVATVLSSTAPMFAIPLGALFLGERVAPRVIVGALVTVAGIGVLQL
jgi:drug/metabolite transporter (DMT)-like permease